MNDQTIAQLISKEKKRQEHTIELIASENFVSPDILQVQGSVLTNKYAEGYPGKRYYGGCEVVDEIEQLAKDRFLSLFNGEHVNVQPHSGSQANMAVYMTILQPGDCVLGMDLAAGGHLTHGHPLNFSGMSYDFVPYGVNDDGRIDYENIRQLAREHRPKLIVAGASAYPFAIDFQQFRTIADEVGAYLMVDMAHIAGLVAANVHENPVPIADFVTTTTHKTLRGPRGGVVFCKHEFAAQLDRAIFPGMQGGPLMHVIAAKAVAAQEATTAAYQRYQRQVILNAQAFAQAMLKNGWPVIGEGTDNHLFLVDVYTQHGLTGKWAQERLDTVGITTNKNTIPNETLSPQVTSGLRLGTPAMTTKGFTENHFISLADLITQALRQEATTAELQLIAEQVQQLLNQNN